MGYIVHVTLNTKKAADWDYLPGVTCHVYHEGETFSVLTMTTDTASYAFDTLDRAHWTQEEPQRMKVYTTKTNYLECCTLLTLDSTFIDNDGVKHFNFSAEPLLMAVPIVEENG